MKIVIKLVLMTLLLAYPIYSFSEICSSEEFPIEETVEVPADVATSAEQSFDVGAYSDIVWNVRGQLINNNVTTALTRFPPGTRIKVEFTDGTSSVWLIGNILLSTAAAPIPGCIEEEPDENNEQDSEHESDEDSDSSVWDDLREWWDDLWEEGDDDNDFDGITGSDPDFVCTRPSDDSDDVECDDE